MQEYKLWPLLYLYRTPSSLYSTHLFSTLLYSPLLHITLLTSSPHYSTHLFSTLLYSPLLHLYTNDQLTRWNRTQSFHVTSDIV
ncbi:hypothetical protein Pmani_034091 [Petrolisthes manimaculis]|uniref:Uncharacterized protein n=1 Tax=Petrolisthes manimaculis TaxID=1843537 RepID=A0AAE1NPH2_9EUCA|nr:hypothetical protein Pmani_034091 [Petrolisthes manimaculis]